tara:strand:+ start:3235 stop:3732 length:498 start_codon:yes stop_codon:yes gene_type:complete
MIMIPHMPHGLGEINAYYGDPDTNRDFVMDDGWLPDHTAVYDLPFPMRTWGGRMTTRFRAHTEIAASIQDALREVMDRVGVEYLREHDADFWGGAWWFRKMTNQPFLSTHSWGIAVDINPHLAPYGEDPSRQPEVLVQAFVNRGWEWGGGWLTPDGHHWQACAGY